MPYILYTDGSCGPTNPGPGGWAFIVLEGEELVREGSGRALTSTTNNRMELNAVLCGLASLEPGAEVLVVTDSQYVVNGIVKGWAARWEQEQYLNAQGEERVNTDLWKALLVLVRERNVTWQWIKAHTRQEDVHSQMNALVDEMAKKARGAKVNRGKKEGGIWRKAKS